MKEFIRLMYMAQDLSGYGTNLKTPADLAALPLAAITDFKAGLSYVTPRQVGTANTGTAQAPVWEARYELITRIVHIATINQDLLDFQNYLKRGMAYQPTFVTPTFYAGLEVDEEEGKKKDTLGIESDTFLLGDKEEKESGEVPVEAWGYIGAGDGSRQTREEGVFRQPYPVFARGVIFADTEAPEALTDEQAQKNLDQAAADQAQAEAEKEDAYQEQLYEQRAQKAGLIPPEPKATKAEAKESESKTKNGHKNGGKK